MSVATEVLSIPPIEQVKDHDKKIKEYGLSSEQLAQRLIQDVIQNQFMVTADITRSLYDEQATFQDEIDIYGMDDWIVGTKRLFVADRSHVELIPDTLQVNDTMASFQFQEYLQFRIPFRPTVYFSGQVLLKRDPKTGLITSYREFWDQDIATVLKSAKFGR